jgi:hypothetical protein
LIQQARIQQAGGQVLYHNGCRVMGALAMSRALGDHALRPYGVIAEPDVATYTRQPEDEFLLLASDGLWGTVSNEDACSIISTTVTELMGLGLTRQQVSAVLPRMLTKVAMGRGSNDNVTVLMMDLRSSTCSMNSSTAPHKAAATELRGSGNGCSSITSAAVACIKRIIQEAIVSWRRQEAAEASAAIPVARAVSAPAAAAAAPAASASPCPAINLQRGGLQAGRLGAPATAKEHNVALAAKLKQLAAAVTVSRAASEQHTHDGEPSHEDIAGTMQQDLPIAMADANCAGEAGSAFALAAAQYAEEAPHWGGAVDDAENLASIAHSSSLTSPFERHQQSALAQVWADWRCFSSSSACSCCGSYGLTSQGSCRSRKRTLQHGPQQQHSNSLPAQDSSALNCSQSAPVKLLHDEPPFKKFAPAIAVQQHVALHASA